MHQLVLAIARKTALCSVLVIMIAGCPKRPGVITNDSLIAPSTKPSLITQTSPMPILTTAYEFPLSATGLHPNAKGLFHPPEVPVWGKSDDWPAGTCYALRSDPALPDSKRVEIAFPCGTVVTWYPGSDPRQAPNEWSPGNLAPQEGVRTGYSAWPMVLSKQ